MCMPPFNPTKCSSSATREVAFGVDLEDLEPILHDRPDAVGPASRATLRQHLLLPDRERARRIGDLYGDPRTQAFAELMIDLEESPHARAVVLGELRERERRGES